MRPRLLSRFTPALLATCLLPACQQANDTVDNIILKSGDMQNGVALAPLPTVLKATVQNRLGDGLRGIEVGWVKGPGSGGNSPEPTTSDDNGEIVTTWTLGPKLGQQQITPRHPQCSCVASFTATAVAPTGSRLVAVGNQQIIAVLGTAVQPPPSVKAEAPNGTGLINAMVTFTVGANGGAIGGSAQVATDADGVAKVGSWNLPNTSGAYTLTATSPDIPGSTVTFTATVNAGAAAQMSRNSVDPQTGTTGSAVGVPPSVKVQDALGNPVSQVPVTFTVTAGGGSVTGPLQNTNTQGIATVGSWTMGPFAGLNTVVASAPGLASVSFSATAAVAIPPGGIVFTSDRDGNKEIYLQRLDGHPDINLTHNPARDDDARWSFNQGRIVFASERADPTIPAELYVMDAAGANPTRITTNTLLDDQPSWAPDGLRVVFHGTRDGVTGIYVMDVDGTNLRLLVSGGDQPEWSPNSSRVVYRASATAGIWQIDPNCHPACPPTAIAGTLPGDRSPTYKPVSGAKIAFTRGTHIWIMNADGSAAAPLTDQDDDSPTWSPDGLQIAFSSKRLGCPHSEIWIVNALSGAVVRVIGDALCLFDDTKPHWR